PAVLVLQGDDPAGALALADGFRAAGWQANVDLRERNQSATRRVAQRQGYAALARRTEERVELHWLADGRTVTFDGIPTPDEAGGR
ncbi:MAG TPA: hypothetical protein VFV93_09960, partial [Thermomicrobiales bacterium]|nr:hypothetical protein [Thermomicrobiales bacterium]